MKFCKEYDSEGACLLRIRSSRSLQKYRSALPQKHFRHLPILPKNIEREDSSTSLGSTCYHQYCWFIYHYGNKPTNKSEIVVECLPPELYKKVAQILGLDPNQEPIKTGNKCKLQGLQELGYIKTDDELIGELERDIEQEIGIRSDLSQDLHVDYDTVKDSEHWDSSQTKKDNPYLKLVKKIGESHKESEAKHNLGKRSSEITQKIISDFVTWFQELGGDPGGVSIDEDIVRELFQIGFEMPAAKALAVRIKEMPTIPETLAEIRGEKELAIQNCLRRFLIDDALTEAQKPRTIGFGTTLPRKKPPLYFKPPKNRINEIWFDSQNLRSELDTMQTVFDGIENLRSTLAYCDWLKRNPDIPPPKYLVDKGIMDVDYKNLLQLNAKFVDKKQSDLKNDEKESILQGRLIIPGLKIQQTNVNKQDEHKFVRECRKTNF